MEEGKIVIGVKQDQSEFDKNNKTLQKKMDTAETKKIKIEVDESNIESVKKRIDELYETLTPAVFGEHIRGICTK